MMTAWIITYFFYYLILIDSRTSIIFRELLSSFSNVDDMIYYMPNAHWYWYIGFIDVFFARFDQMQLVWPSEIDENGTSLSIVIDGIIKEERNVMFGRGSQFQSWSSSRWLAILGRLAISSEKIPVFRYGNVTVWGLPDGINFDVSIIIVWIDQNRKTKVKNRFLGRN